MWNAIGMLTACFPNYSASTDQSIFSYLLLLQTSIYMDNSLSGILNIGYSMQLAHQTIGCIYAKSFSGDPKTVKK